MCLLIFLGMILQKQQLLILLLPLITNWNIPQTINLQVVDDFIFDENQTSTITGSEVQVPMLLLQEQTNL